ncbi:TetR/AcrR family transcriptional regulator [Blastococcus sp. TF02-8]|nr:TetR/AcrR family transcriptional regulator [Blastococcus sp. TF02-8]
MAAEKPDGRCGGSVSGSDGPVDADTPEARGGAAATIPAAPPGAGRTSLDRRRVLGAALAFIDENGLDALTMRGLGAYLGVEGMALYRHVSGRDALLDGVVEIVIDELYGDPDVHLRPTHGWQDFLQRLAHGLRRIALAHPAVFPLIATRPPAAPWVRPPLRSLRWVESFLDALAEHGFTDESAVAAYRAYTSFLLGHLLLEVSQLGVPISSRDKEAAAQESTTDLSEYPHLLRVEPLLSRDESAAEFEESLENLLDRLERLLQSQRSGRRSR